jgi:hypothetical protein
MQYPNNLPNITPNIIPTPEYTPINSPNSLPQTQLNPNISTDEGRIKQVALAALEQIATASTFDQRLKLANTLINTGGQEAASILSLRFTELGFAPTKKKEWNQCFELVTRITHEAPDNALSLLTAIARQGGDAARELVTHLNVDEIKPENRLELYKLIARQGVLPAIELAENFDNLGLYDKNGNEFIPGQTLALCKEILNQGADAAATLGVNFSQIKMPEEDIFPFLNYVVYKGLQKKFVENDEFFNSIPEEFKIQALVDLLSPPSRLRGSIDLTLFESFTEPLAPLLPILNKEPGDINESDIQNLKIFISENPNLHALNPIINNIEKDTQKMIRDSLVKDSKKAVKKGEAKITEEAAFFRAGMYSWLAYAAVVLDGLAPEQVDAIIGSNSLNLIASYPHSSLRYSLTRLFSELPEEELEALSPSVNPDNNAQESTQLQKISLLLSPLTNFGASEQKNIALQTQIKNTRALKQVSVSSALIQLLSTITLHGPYTQVEADKIADCIIKALKQPEITGKTEKSSKKEGEEKVKKEISTKEELTKNDLAALTNILQMLGKKEMFDFVAPENKNVSAETFFQNNFKKFFDVDEAELEKLGMTFEDQYKKTFGQFRDPLALFSYYKGINRLPPNEKIPVLATLNTFVNTVLREDFKDVRYNPENSAHLTKVFNARPDLKSLWRTPLPSKRVVNLEEEGEVTESEAIASAEDLESETKEKMELSDTDFELMEIDDPCDLFLIGTEIRGSCQSVFADPQKNQALTSYLMNGEIKAIGIKQNGKIVARVLMRLMWDEKNKCPVLLQEQLFANAMNETLAEAIYAFTKEKARSMRIPLVSQNIETEVRYKEKVNFLGGMAPVGYSDSTEGLLVKHPKTSAIIIPKITVGTPPSHQPIANAPFDVSNTYMLYDPKEDEEEVVVHTT